MPKFDEVDDDATNRALRCVLLMVDIVVGGELRGAFEMSRGDGMD